MCQVPGAQAPTPHGIPPPPPRSQDHQILVSAQWALKARAQSSCYSHPLRSSLLFNAGALRAPKEGRTPPTHTTGGRGDTPCLGGGRGGLQHLTHIYIYI